MSSRRNDPTEILVAVHRDTANKNAVLVSINGESKRATWVARSQIILLPPDRNLDGRNGRQGQPRSPAARQHDGAGVARQGSGVHLT